jgi:hypothetical protein
MILIFSNKRRKIKNTCSFSKIENYNCKSQLETPT